VGDAVSACPPPDRQLPVSIAEPELRTLGLNPAHLLRGSFYTGRVCYVNLGFLMDNTRLLTRANYPGVLLPE